MKKLILSILLSGSLAFVAKAQEAATVQEFNKWSVEASVGFNKAMAPFSAGFVS